MMAHSQVRCAILLSFILLKVRRMKSLALLWATAGPDCRSLKLYWVSAKALTLPISHHGSSQLSLPSGLIPSPERINTQSLCSLYTWAFPLLKSRPRSTLISSFLVCLQCITTNISSWVILRYDVSVGQRELAFCTDWKLRIYCGLWWASCDFIKWCFSPNLSDITKLSFVKLFSCGAPYEWGSAPGGVRGGLGQRQVCRCHVAG